MMQYVKPDYLKLLALLKTASEVEAMLRTGEVDYKRLAGALRKFGINVSEETLKEIKNEYEETGDKATVIRKVAEMLGISPESIEDAITLFELLSTA